ncbi:hypothetical protein DFH27DRAFT_485283 [Peziza echinospora]|nr:hypothetical protein DFH27DRAFT_485283 [Peziza echinospora]
MLDPILSWQHSLYNGGIAPLANLNDPNSTSKRICLINAAHDERAGGDWVSSATCQEDSICRRSTLYHALTHPAPGEIKRDFYPLETGGIYSPNVVVHKDGPSGLFRNYENPGDCTIISVVSVPPERAPMLGGDGCYLFDMERDLQRSKMATALRIAAVHKHRNVAIGMFGSVNREVPEYSTRKANRGGGVHGQGPLHDERRDINPIREVAALWSGLLENDRGEFAGLFDNVVFVVGTGIRAADDAHCLSKAFRLPAVSKLVKSWYPDQYDDLL